MHVEVQQSLRVRRGGIPRAEPDPLRLLREIGG